MESRSRTKHRERHTTRIRGALQRAFANRGYIVVRRSGEGPADYADIEPEFFDFYRRCIGFTEASVERSYALYQSVRYVVQEDVPGDIVECGVWRGGSSMLAALTLRAANDRQRSLFLYDTFEGMSEPTAADVTTSGDPAAPEWARQQGHGVNAWCYASLDDVRANIRSTGFPSQRTIFIKGKCEDTLPGTTPDRIAVLRLDTDWFESTYHELVHLYPLLSPGGVLLLDDYGHWQGARAATDQYFKESRERVLLTRIDHSARLAIKLEPEY